MNLSLSQYNFCYLFDDTVYKKKYSFKESFENVKYSYTQPCSQGSYESGHTEWGHFWDVDILSGPHNFKGIVVLGQGLILRFRLEFGMRIFMHVLVLLYM